MIDRLVSEAREALHAPGQATPELALKMEEIGQFSLASALWASLGNERMGQRAGLIAIAEARGRAKHGGPPDSFVLSNVVDAGALRKLCKDLVMVVEQLERSVINIDAFRCLANTLPVLCHADRILVSDRKLAVWMCRHQLIYDIDSEMQLFLARMALCGDEDDTHANVIQEQAVERLLSDLSGHDL